MIGGTAITVINNTKEHQPGWLVFVFICIALLIIIYAIAWELFKRWRSRR